MINLNKKRFEIAVSNLDKSEQNKVFCILDSLLILRNEANNDNFKFLEFKDSYRKKVRKLLKSFPKSLLSDFNLWLNSINI